MSRLLGIRSRCQRGVQLLLCSLDQHRTRLHVDDRAKLPLRRRALGSCAIQWLAGVGVHCLRFGEGGLGGGNLPAPLLDALLASPEGAREFAWLRSAVGDETLLNRFDEAGPATV